ncbi:MAG: hypothetical protein ACXVZQ_13475 [Terriglobales bacterium]
MLLLASAWILSLPRFGFVHDVFGYTPPWMFAVLLAAAAVGTLASVKKAIWWIAVALSCFSFCLMLAFNNV